MKKNHLLIIACFFASTIFLITSCKKDSSTKPNDPVTLKSGQADAVADSMIVTPEGLMPKSHVHLIEDGNHLEVRNGHVVKIETLTGKLMADFGIAHSAAGSPRTLQMPTNGGRSRYNPLSRTPSSGPANWQTYASWNSPGNATITYFSTNWTVPAAPTSNDQQVIYLFNGLEDENEDDIMQPVLQWGFNTAFGGQYWVISNWYVWGVNNAAYTTSYTVAPGTVLQGTLTYNGVNGGSYIYTSSFANQPNSTPMTIKEGNSYDNFFIPGSNIALQQIYSQTWAFETLEVYHLVNGKAVPEVVQSSDYPSNIDVPMTGIDLLVNNAATSVGWATSIGQYAVQGEHTNIVSNNSSGSGEVDIFFHPQPPPPSFTYFTPDDFTINQLITPLNPTNNGTAPTSYSVSPTLPSGLMLNAKTGVISGTPNTLSAAANYVITGSSEWGKGTFTISIVVGNSYPFVVSSQSQSSTIYNLVFNGNTVLSGDLVNSDHINDLNLVYTPNSNSTVVMQAASGYAPVGATLYGNFAPINGTINGRTITFTGVNLNGAQCQIVIN